MIKVPGGWSARRAVVRVLDTSQALLLSSQLLTAFVRQNASGSCVMVTIKASLGFKKKKKTSL